MNKTSIFQIVLIGVFAVFIVAGFVALYLTKGDSGSGSGSESVSISIWGTESASSLNAMFNALKLSDNGFNIIYKQISENTFNQEVLEALAAGRGPDAFVLPHDMLIKFSDKIFPIPYESYSLDDLKNNYVVAGEIVKSSDGILGVPFGLDPIIMYWNRDYFATNGLSNPPKYWDEFLTLAEDLTKKSTDGLQIERSAVSIGNFDNVNNAKEIFSAMLMQVGEYPILQSSTGALSVPGSRLLVVPVTDFYASFANPKKPNYTWSKNLKNSLNLFAEGDLGIYFGFASDNQRIKNLNPNLDYGVYYFPQPRDAKTNITFGKVLTLAVSKWSQNRNAVVSLAFTLSNNGTSIWAKITGTAPVTRAGLTASPVSNFEKIVYDSALWSRNWPDPDYSMTNNILGTIISNVSSGWKRTLDAWQTADNNLKSLIR